MKNVPNLISYLHEFFWNFSQFLAIFFELFSSGVIYLNSKFDWRVGPACQWQCRAALNRDWLPRAALSGHTRGSLNTLPTVPRPPAAQQPRVRRLDSLTTRRSPRSPRHRPDRAAIPTAVVRSRRRSAPSPCRLTARPSRRAAVPAPVSRPISSAVSRALVGCRRWAAYSAAAVCVARGPRQRREHGSRPCGRGPRAHAVQLGRARFHRVTLGLDLYYLNIFNSLQIQKFVYDSFELRKL
jgi:hypothetical protein